MYLSHEIVRRAVFLTEQPEKPKNLCKLQRPSFTGTAYEKPINKVIVLCTRHLTFTMERSAATENQIKFATPSLLKRHLGTTPRTARPASVTSLMIHEHKNE